MGGFAEAKTLNFHILFNTFRCSFSHVLTFYVSQFPTIFKTFRRFFCSRRVPRRHQRWGVGDVDWRRRIIAMVDRLSPRDIVRRTSAHLKPIAISTEAVGPFLWRREVACSDIPSMACSGPPTSTRRPTAPPSMTWRVAELQAASGTPVAGWEPMGGTASARRS